MRSWPGWQWQYTRAVRSGGLAVARFRRGAFPGGNPWQFLRSMYPKGGLGRENRQFVARFARHASEMSWLWQDLRAMHPKCPANRRRRIHHVNILPGRGPFRCTNPSNHARRADLATIQRSQGLAYGRQEELGIASALRIAADGPTTVVAHICGSRVQPRQQPLCDRWRKPMRVSAAASEQCSGAYARPAPRHPPVRSVCLASGIRPPAVTFSAGASRRPRPPNDSRMFPWRILLHSGCPHFFGQRPPSTQHKKGQRLLAFFARL